MPKNAKTKKTLGLKKLNLTSSPSRMGVVLAAAAFVVIFVGIGTWYVEQSRAATGYCVDDTYSIGDSGGCVRDLQTVLNNFYYREGSVINRPSRVFPLATDGDFGSNTQGAVKDFQNWVNTTQCSSASSCNHIGIYDPLTVDGVVGGINNDGQTWPDICRTAYMYGIAYDDAGCAATHLIYGF